MFSLPQSQADLRDQKRELRRVLRARRRALPRWKRQRAGRRLAYLAGRQAWYRRAGTLALYLASDGEIDPTSLIRKALSEGKCILLPRLRQQCLEFVRYAPGVALRRNRFDIPEPAGRAVPLRKVDVVCMPLVGFDRRGGRLGMGGGFYDRTFAEGGVGRGGPRLIGLAYAFQEVTRLPQEQWDVPMRGVVTEREWIGIR